MSYTSRDRDRFRLAVAAVTGVSTVGALTATGWLIGKAADDFAAQQAAASAQQQQAQQQAKGAQQQGRQGADRQRPARPQLRQRPHVTRVTVRYVTGTTSSNPVGGGTVSAPVSSSGSSGGSSGSSGSGSSSSGPGPAPAPPPPPPPAAPSSGS